MGRRSQSVDAATKKITWTRAKCAAYTARMETRLNTKLKPPRMHRSGNFALSAQPRGGADNDTQYAGPN